MAREAMWLAPRVHLCRPAKPECGALCHLRKPEDLD